MGEPKHNFRVRVHRPNNPQYGGPYPKVLAGTWAEPAEAADAAEIWLKDFGKEDESYADLLFNGDPEPQTSIFYQGKQDDGWGEPVFGVWNRSNAPWPIDYIDDGTGEHASNKLELHPSEFLPPLPSEIEAEDGKHKKSDESDVMKLDGEDDAEKAFEDDDAEDEVWDDPGDEDAENDAESDTDPDDDYEGDADDEDEDEEDLEEDDEDSDSGDDPGAEGTDEEDQSEIEDDEEGEDQEREESEDDSEIEDEEDGEEDGEDSDEGTDEGDSEIDPDDDGDDDGEPPMRLPIFAKMRGPKGWRKRAEAEDLNLKNTFGLKVGVLHPEGETPGKQEADVRCEIQFVETDEQRTHGTLRIKLPETVTLDDFMQSGKWITVNVPYTDETM